jgi:hypothetical protein
MLVVCQVKVLRKSTFDLIEIYFSEKQLDSHAILMAVLGKLSFPIANQQTFLFPNKQVNNEISNYFLTVFSFFPMDLIDLKIISLL